MKTPLSFLMRPSATLRKHKERTSPIKRECMRASGWHRARERFCITSAMAKHAVPHGAQQPQHVSIPKQSFCTHLSCRRLMCRRHRHCLHRPPRRPSPPHVRPHQSSLLRFVLASMHVIACTACRACMSCALASPWRHFCKLLVAWRCRGPGPGPGTCGAGLWRGADAGCCPDDCAVRIRSDHHHL